MAAKPKNYREMTEDELAKELDGITKTLFGLRVRRVTDVVENPAAFRHHRREIARIKTELRSRELKRETEAEAKRRTVPAPAKPAAPAAKK